MENVFLKVLNMSISASIIVFIVIALRLLLKKAPKWVNVLMWGIVSLRLIIPFTVESKLSLMPNSENIIKIPIVTAPDSQQIIPIEPAVNPGNTYIPSTNQGGIPLTENSPFDTTSIIAIIWIIGIAALLIYTLISYIRLKRKIGTAVLLKDNIYQSENVVSPFVLGIIMPKIYVPFDISGQDLTHVIAHEKSHISRKDHLWKPLGFLILTVHWFNPVIWVSYILLCRDIEMSCDQKVIKELNKEQKANYSSALLSCSINHRSISACPLAFGEVGVKIRIKSVLNYKKPAFWIIVTAVITSIAVAVCFLTNPKKEDLSGITEQTVTTQLNGVSLEIVGKDFSSVNPYLEIKWNNSSGEDIVFGEKFTIYRKTNGNWENCSLISDPVWHLVAYHVENRGLLTHKYNLLGQIMTKPGKYKFETCFTTDKDHETEYTVHIEFTTTETVKGTVLLSFKAEKLVYSDGSFSFVQTAEGAPNYIIANNMQLLEKYGQNASTYLGTLEEIALKEKTFDSRFRWNDICWFHGDSLESIKQNNSRIWQLYATPNENNSELYILLEQNDGTYYLGYGYYNEERLNPEFQNSDNSYIRWLYKLQTVSGYDELVLTSPPEMVVLCNEIGTVASMGTTSWFYTDESGTEQAIMNDGNHPLLMKETMAKLDILPSYYSAYNPYTAYIQFNARSIQPVYSVVPDELTIRYWSEADWNNINAKSTETVPRIVNGNIYFDLQRGNYIYEITAKFSSNENYGGTARYYFYTVQPNLDYHSSTPIENQLH